MTIEVRVPQLPESVADATLVTWHKRPGDTVARDENLVDLETDKVVLEAAAPAALAPAAAATAAGAGAGAVAPAGGSSAAKLSPAAKRVAEENRVDPKALQGSGRDGRVSKSDVVNYLQAKESTPAASPAGSPAA